MCRCGGPGLCNRVPRCTPQGELKVTPRPGGGPWPPLQPRAPSPLRDELPWSSHRPRETGAPRWPGVRPPSPPLSSLSRPVGVTCLGSPSPALQSRDAGRAPGASAGLARSPGRHVAMGKEMNEPPLGTLRQGGASLTGKAGEARLPRFRCSKEPPASVSLEPASNLIGSQSRCFLWIILG